MDATSSPAAGAAHRLREAATPGYARDDLEAALVQLASERDQLRAAIALGRDRTVELATATISAGTLEEDLAQEWLEAERSAARVRADADAAAATSLREAEAQAAAIVAAALAEAAGHPGSPAA